ncbi:hypothetical protein [Deinococcus petrolearius]|uniref:Uncharacterized protein n=1 Tax=Deinococcus petrolearius TaxID=1751295 RepID=A0ABW1DHG9_9DEIO
MPPVLTRLAAPLALLCALLGTAPAAAPAGYYPQAAGTAWTYSNGERQVLGAPVTYRGVRVVPLSHVLGRVLVSQDLLEYRADGSVWLRGLHTGRELRWYAAPVLVYPAGPLQPGQSWRGAGRTTQVTGVQGVTTPAGTFNALVLRTQAVGGAPQDTLFVPGVGVVRYRTADGRTTDLTARK